MKKRDVDDESGRKRNEKLEEKKRKLLRFDSLAPLEEKKNRERLLRSRFALTRFRSKGEKKLSFPLTARDT